MKTHFFNSIKNILEANTPVIGIDIGSSTLKIIGMRFMPRPALSFCSIIELAKGINESQLAIYIQNALGEHKATPKNAVLVFSEEAAVIRRVDMPQVSSDETLEALKWHARDMIHFDIDAACFNFKHLGDSEKEDGSKFTKLIFTAVPSATIDRYVKIIKAAGLNPISVTIAPFGLENILRQQEDAQSIVTSLVVELGHSKTEISIFHKNELEFVRTIPVGSAAITEAMTAQLVSNDRMVGLSSSEAEEIKRRIGIPYDNVIVEKGLSATQLLSLMRPVLERIYKEIRRSIDYYTQEYGKEDVKIAYLTGGGSNLKGLETYLSEELNIPVKRLDLSRSLDVSKAIISPEAAAGLAALAGVVLGWKKVPNLLPHEYKVERIELIEKISLRMIATILAVVILSYFALMKFRIDEYKYRLKNLKFQAGVFNQIKDLQERVNERVVLLDRLEMGSLHLEDVSRDLSNIVPPNAIFSEMNIDLRGKTLSIKGVIQEPRGVAEESLSEFTRKMEAIGHFKEAQLSALQSATFDGSEASKFEIDCWW